MHSCNKEMKPKSIPSCTVKFEASYRHAVQGHRLDHAVDLASMYIYIHMQQEIYNVIFSDTTMSCESIQIYLVKITIWHVRIGLLCMHTILAAMMYIVTIANIS